jgi:uncharacterized GH25 family protein
MTLKKNLIALALAGLSLASLSAQAHKPYILPLSSEVEAGRDGVAWASFDASIGENLFDPDFTLKLDGLVITAPDGSTLQPENVGSGKTRTTFDLKLAKPGTYKLALVSKNVMGSYKDKQGETKRFRATEETLAKEVPADAADVKLSRMESRLETFVSTGTPDMAVFKATGVGLEMIPVTNPTELRAGEKATWRFLIDGKPAAGQGVSLIAGGVRYRGTLGEIRQTTDARGELTLTLPAAGAYMVSTAWPAVQRVEGQPMAMVPRRLSYSAVVEILPQ